MISSDGRITALSISKRKGTSKTNVDSVHIIEDQGIEGDVHAGRWHRQISLLAMESIEKIRAKACLRKLLKEGRFTSVTFSRLSLPEGLRASDRW